MKVYNTGISKGGERGGTIFKLLVFLVVFGCVVSAAWIYFLPIVLTSALQKRTGFPVKVTQLAFNPFTARVDVKGLVISNPPGFPRAEFINVTSFEANAQMKTIFGDDPVFDYARLEVASVALVRDADGVLNAQLFNDRLNPSRDPKEDAEKKSLFGSKKDEGSPDASATQGGPGRPKVDPAKADPKAKAKTADAAAKDKKQKDAKEQKEQNEPPKPAEKPIHFTIGRLELSLGKIIVADYAAPKPETREYNCKLYYTFNNFTDPKQLMAPFALKGLQPVGAAIRGLIPGDIGKAVGAATQPVEPMLPPTKPKDAKDDKEPATDPLKTVVEKLEESQKP